jgi:hypothetical protein
LQDGAGHRLLLLRRQQVKGVKKMLCHGRHIFPLVPMVRFQHAYRDDPRTGGWMQGVKLVPVPNSSTA